MRHPHCSTTYVPGGAIYNDATLIVSGTTFDGNTVNSDFASCIYGYGGAVFNDYYGIFLSTGNLYTNNAAYEGGAVFNYSEYGQASFERRYVQRQPPLHGGDGLPDHRMHDVLYVVRG